MHANARNFLRDMEKFENYEKMCLSLISPVEGVYYVGGIGKTDKFIIV